MLKLCALQLYNWGYAPFQVPLPIGDITLLRGPNGSGKTTYLSAIALLLGVRNLPKRQMIDKFIYPGETWAFLRGLADNQPDERGRRPFDAILPTLAEDVVTLACMLERQNGGWSRTYFIVPGDEFSPEPGQVVEKSYCFSQKEYRRALALVGVHDTLLNLLELGLYGLRETTRDAVACFKFFLKLVGDEEIQQRYQQARQDWWRQREQTRQLEVRQMQETETMKQMGEQIKLLRQRRYLQSVISQAGLLVKHAQVRDWRQELASLRLERTTVSDKLDQQQQALAAIQVKRENFNIEHQRWQAAYEQWRRDRDQAERAAGEIRQIVAKVDTEYKQQQQKVEAIQTLPDVPLAEVETAQARAETAEFEAHSRWEALQGEERNLKAEEEHLLARRTPWPGPVKNFMQVLQLANIPYLLVADAVEVIDPRWQQAVEGALGGERYTVIVEDDVHQVTAKKLGQQHDYRFYISPPNDDKVLRAEKDSLWEVVRVSDERARGWVGARLGPIRRVDTIETGHALARQGITNITDQAYLQERRGGRSLRPRELVCGQAAREFRLHQVRTRLHSIASELAEAKHRWQQAKAALEECQEATRRARTRSDLPKEMAYLAELEQTWQTRQAEAAERETSYQQLKQQEDNWNDQRAKYATQQAQLSSEEVTLQEAFSQTESRLADLSKQVIMLDRKLQELEPDLLPLDEETLRSFNEDTLTAEQYQTRQKKAEEELIRLPEPEYDDLDETLYQRQQESVAKLEHELTQMRQREFEHNQLFEAALEDFRVHVQQLFGEGMHRAFSQLCASASARGRISLQHGEEDQWSLEVRVGFHDKPMQTLESAPLSQGQEVMVGLFLVLAALRAVRATPILLLDELMSTLDEDNAPLVLEQLRVTGAQCFVATPHIRPQADTLADAIWALQPRPEASDHASPVAVLTRR